MAEKEPSSAQKFAQELQKNPKIAEGLDVPEILKRLGMEEFLVKEVRTFNERMKKHLASKDEDARKDAQKFFKEQREGILALVRVLGDGVSTISTQNFSNISQTLRMGSLSEYVLPFLAFFEKNARERHLSMVQQLEYIEGLSWSSGKLRDLEKAMEVLRTEHLPILSLLKKEKIEVTNVRYLQGWATETHNLKLLAPLIDLARRNKVPLPSLEALSRFDSNVREILRYRPGDKELAAASDRLLTALNALSPNIAPQLSTKSIQPFLPVLFVHLQRSSLPLKKDLATTVNGARNLDDASDEDVRLIIQTAFSSTDSYEHLLKIIAAVSAGHSPPLDRKQPFSVIQVEFSFQTAAFLRDPAIHAMVEAAAFIPKTAWESDYEIPLKVGRFLHRRKQKVTREAVEKAIESIEKGKTLARSVEVMGPGRGVTVFGHNEMLYRLKGETRVLSQSQVERYLFLKQKTKDDFEVVGPRFAKKGLIDALRATGSDLPDSRIYAPPPNNILETFDREKYRKELQERKKGMLLSLETIPPPHTFLFDGHGGPDAFWIADGEVGTERAGTRDDPRALHVDDIAEALLKRHERFKAQPKDLGKDVILFISCRSQEFSDAVDRKLGSLPYRPYIVSVAEFGQVGFSDFGSLAGSRYADRLLGLEKPKRGPTNLGDVMDRQKSAGTNITIYAPYRETDGAEAILMQIATYKEGSESELPS